MHGAKRGVEMQRIALARCVTSVTGEAAQQDKTQAARLKTWPKTPEKDMFDFKLVK